MHLNEHAFFQNLTYLPFAFFLFVFFLPKSLPLKTEEDGPLPAAKFYGPVQPAASLRTLNESVKESAKPSLKEAFTTSTPANPQQSIPLGSKKRRRRSAQLTLDALIVAGTTNPNKFL